MANNRVFIVICLASILYSFDCAPENNQQKPTVSSKEQVINAPSNNTVTPTNGTPIMTPAPINSTTVSTTPKTTSTSSSTTPPSSSTITPTTSPKPITTTAAPNKHDRSFDLPSFIGGVILSLGLAAIGYVVYKFYKTRIDPNYRTL